MLIDSHCHLDFAVFDADRRQVCCRSAAVGITDIIVPAVQRTQWQSVALLQGSPLTLHHAYGLHPLFVEQHHEEDIRLLDEWLSQHHSVAIGEIGLDGRRTATLSAQRHYFAAQLELAQQHALPVIIHAHRALEEVIQTLRRYRGIAFVIHAFSGSDQQLAAVLEMGGIIGVGGSVTYERAQRLRRQVAALQAGQFVLETDAPDQPVCGYQGQRNEPSRLALVAESVADLQGRTPAEIAKSTTMTAQHFFQLNKTKRNHDADSTGKNRNTIG